MSQRGCWMSIISSSMCQMSMWVLKDLAKVQILISAQRLLNSAPGGSPFCSGFDRVEVESSVQEFLRSAMHYSLTFCHAYTPALDRSARVWGGSLVVWKMYKYTNEFISFKIVSVQIAVGHSGFCGHASFWVCDAAECGMNQLEGYSRSITKFGGLALYVDS